VSLVLIEFDELGVFVGTANPLDIVDLGLITCIRPGCNKIAVCPETSKFVIPISCLVVIYMFPVESLPSLIYDFCFHPM